MAVPRALSGIVAIPQEAEPGISRTAAAAPSAKPSTAKMPVWSAPATKTTSTPDTQAPTAVTGLHLLGNTETAITVAWDPAKDNVAVKLYLVKGDGFGTVQTADTKAGLTWAHRTTNVTVQVCAVDTSGNQGDWRSLVVAPPTVVAGTTNAPKAPATTAAAAPTTTEPAQPVTTAPPPPATDASTPAVTQSASAQQTAGLAASASVQQTAATVATSAQVGQSA